MIRGIAFGLCWFASFARAADGGAIEPDGGVPLKPPVQERATREPLLGGRHWRLVTADGVVHVWTPPRYQAWRAGVVLYVHGYYTDVDGAWRAHRLAKQFDDSRRNALFIAPEAPSGGSQDVQFKDLAALLSTVSRLTKLPVPQGPVVAAGHSGAWRTLANWLAEPRLAEILLVDGLYADEAAFDAWLSAEAQPPRRLVLVGYETAVRSEAFCDRFPDAQRRSDVPARDGDVPRAAREARLLYWQSQFDHMGLITQGHVLPLLLRTCRSPPR